MISLLNKESCRQAKHAARIRTDHSSEESDADPCLPGSTACGGAAYRRRPQEDRPSDARPCGLRPRLVRAAEDQRHDQVVNGVAGDAEDSCAR